MNSAADLKSAAQGYEPSARDRARGAEGAAGTPPVASARGQEPLLTEYQRRMIAEGHGTELTLGPYRILDELGRGGFGRVLKAEHSIMNRVVALKVLAPEYTHAQHWLLREVRAATRLTHPNIALAYDANVIDGTLYFAMEFVDGPSLETLVGKRGPLPVPFVCAVIRQTALALQCAHDLGMVHRDIKPANLLLVQAEVEKLLDAPAGRADPAAVLVKVVDFGLARLHPKGTPGSFTIDRDLGLFGTPGYIAPEQADNVHDADIRSDLYAVGCTMYFALAGRPPFTGGSTAEVVTRQRDKPPKPLELLRPDVPPALVGIVRQLMARKPEQRFQTPADLLKALAYAQLSWSQATVSTATDAAGRTEHAGKASPPPPPEDHAAAAGGRDVPEANAPASAGKLSPPEGASGQARLQPPAEPVVPALSTRPEQLGQLWQRWRDVVGEVAKGQASRLTADEYKAVHRALLGALRSGRADPHATRRELLARVELLVEPWLSYDVLVGLDRRAAASLWQCCLGVDRDLLPRPPGAGGRRLLCLAAGCVLVGLVIFVLAMLLYGKGP